MNPKLYRFFKHFTALLIVALFVANCEKDDVLSSSDDKTQILLNLNTISSRLNFGNDNLFIDWDSPVLLYQNKKETSSQIQYPILFEKNIKNNTEIFAEQSTLYLITNENINKESISILHFEPFKYSSNTNPSKTHMQNFSGMVSEYDVKGQLKEIYVFENGKELTTFSESKALKAQTSDLLSYISDNKHNDCIDENGAPIFGCSSGGNNYISEGYFRVETTRHYTDWYNKCNSCNSNDGNIYNHTDGNKYVYVKTTYDGSSVRWVWVSDGTDIYRNFYNSKTGGGGNGPTHYGDRNYSFASVEGEEVLPCPIGYEKVGTFCVKIEEDKDSDEIINELTGKADCVYGKLESLSTDFKTMIQKFDGEFPVAHLKFEMKDLGTTRGLTIAPDGTGNSPDYVITIQLNNNSNMHGVNYRPNLMTAKTIAHEVIHAEMFRKLLSVLDNGGNIAGLTRQQILNVKNNFPGLYDYYTRYNFNTSTPNNAQHQQMATHYIETLADILKAYDNNQHSYQFYMDLAWEGLKYPNIYTWSSLPQQEKNKINKTISDYINSNKNEQCQD